MTTWTDDEVGGTVWSEDEAAGTALGAATGSSLVGFVQSGSGATSRTLQTKVREVELSAKDFGAAGDGVTDDSSVLQAAVTAALANNGVLDLPSGTYNIGTTGLTVAAGSTLKIRGGNREEAKILYSGTGTALTIGDSATDTLNVCLEGLTVECTGVGANGISLVRTQGGYMRDVYIQGRTSGSDSGTGLSVQGTGNYAGNMEFTRVRVNGNWTTAWDFDGPSTNTCNNHYFQGCHSGRTTAKPGTSTVGFKWGSGCGDGDAMGGIDIEGYDTGFDIDGRILYGVLRAENNTTGIDLGATSVGNRIFLQGFTNTTSVTEHSSATFNFVTDHIGMYGRLAYSGGDNRLILRSNADQRVDLELYAGSSAEKEERIRFLTMAGALAFQIKKSTINDLIIDDGTNTIMRFVSGPSAVFMSRRFTYGQGAAVTAANNLALGLDGNYFQIDGATQINLISSSNWNGGAVVTLKFNSTPTVKHNQATSGTNRTIQLAGAVDFVATAGDTLTLRYDSTDTAWYEMSRAVI